MATGLRAEMPEANVKCMECHGVKGLSSTDPITGEFLNLTVNQEVYERSVHGRLLCLKCHARGYLDQPHTSHRRRDAFACITCHAKDDGLQPAEKTDFKNEILRSIHKKPLGKRLDCNACHDPHTFERIGKMQPKRRIKKSNAICLKCHSQWGAAGAFKKAQRLNEIHEWLPNKTAHHKEVACVTCHGGRKGSRPHLLVSQKRMVHKCESCHTPETGSLAAQYRGGQKPKVGGLFLSEAVWNEAYVIGATRHRLLDAISLYVFGFLILGMMGHALLRMIKSRKKAS
jgi:mono/diheme cytochrome c family protein